MPDAPACSILFATAQHRPVERTEPGCFRDLNLDQVVAALVRGREEYDLAPFFSTPLHDPDAVTYRQEALRDLESRELRDAIDAFATAMQTMRRYLSLVTKLRYHHEKQRWFLHAAQTYCDAVAGLAGDLARSDLQSQGLRAFCDYLSGYVASDGFTRLVADTGRVVDRLGEVRYNLHISGLWITVTRYEGQADYSTQVAAIFERFKRGAVGDYLADLPDAGALDHVEAGVLERVARLYPDVFAALDRYCTTHAGVVDNTVATFDRQVQFYLAYLDFIAPLQRAGLPLCYPQITDHHSKDVYARDTFDLALARKLVTDGETVVRNDMTLTDPERIIVVSGPNQGGKTTFARTFGQLHHLAGIGCLVPGRRARLFLADRVFTHFAKEEQLSDLRGQLQDDLLRIHDVLAHATPDSVVVINEIFSSTTLADATLLGARILEQVMALDALCVYVTFVDELASLGEATVSMVSTVDPHEPAVRTFKVVRRPADGLALRAGHRRETPPDLRARQGADRLMNAFLMHRDADFDLERPLPANAAALTQDLGLDTLLQAMARGDAFLFDVARHAVLSSLTDPDDIAYRQDILRDCLAHPAVARELYGLAVEAVVGKRKMHYGSFIRTPGSVLYGSVQVLAFLVGILRRLRQIADSHAAGFRSDGFTAFFATLARDLDDDYFAAVEDHLRRLRFRDGVLISAELGRGNRGTSHVLREQPRPRSWIARLLPAARPGYTLRIPDRDEAGARALSELRDRGINLVANAVGQSADHIVSFVTMLRRELAFYVGCLNLHDQLAAKREPVCIPPP
jgi:hypothetical protein